MQLWNIFHTIERMLLATFVVSFRIVVAETPYYMCDSTVFCRGPILEAVNSIRLYDDSKDFVDMPMIKSPEETLKAFNETFPDPMNITKAQLKTFMDKYFLPPGREMLGHQPEDYQEKPKNFDAIKDPYYRNWAYSLNKIWLQLSKEVNKSVMLHPERYSLVYVPYPFMIPGGRFREFYNWDTYWIELGLLASGMYNTTKNIIKNFAYLVNRYGLIPNGARTYYLERSHPPFFIPMAYRYYEATQDHDLIYQILPSLEKELQFWMTNRSVEIPAVPYPYPQPSSSNTADAVPPYVHVPVPQQNNRLIRNNNRNGLINNLNELKNKNNNTILVYRFTTRTNVPRPESYAEDVETAQNKSTSDKPFLYRNLAAGAETGWDFTSRFLADHVNLGTIITNRILPVDLNAYVCANFRMISELFAMQNNTEKAAKYKKYYNDMVNIMMTLFFNQSEGVWFDYNLDTKAHNLNFYPSNVIPLYAGCYKFDESSKNESFSKIASYIKNSGALNFPYGVPASLSATAQQWDFPNGWPPLNHMIVEGFDQTNHSVLREMALKLADDWLRNGYLTYENHSMMYEKYNVELPQQPGSGGEYAVQLGFGWTNGVALDLLMKYGDRLSFNGTVKPWTDINSTAATFTTSAPPISGATSDLVFHKISHSTNNLCWLTVTLMSHFLACYIVVT